MCRLEQKMNVWSFFVMDENFLLHRRRALKLLELIEKHDKAWALYVFSSANVLKSYTVDQLVRLGISWVWMGVEGEDSQYTKLRGADTRKLVAELQSHGIRVLGSTIIGLENHTPENIDQAIDYAVSHDTDFHQFMLYTPLAGTPLHAELTAKGVMKDSTEVHPADAHGQFVFNYRHPHITGGEESEFMIRAFKRDFDVNGPSVARIVRTTLTGWKRYKNHPDSRIHRRYALEAKDLGTMYAAVIWALKRYYRKDPTIGAMMSDILRDLYAQFGLKARLFARIGGPYVLWKIRREQKRLAAGWTYEPPTFYEKNYDGDRAGLDGKAAAMCQYVTPAVAAAAEPKPEVVEIDVPESAVA